MNQYQENLLDHYKNPRNFGKPEWDTAHKFRIQNLSCGDEIGLWLKIEDGKINDVRFDGEGCSIAIGAASILTEELKGKPIDTLKKYKLEEFFNKLGIELTLSRQKCASLGFEAMKEAIN